MDRVLFGELECIRVPYSKALRKHVEKRISDWISAQQFPEYPKGLSFHVVLEKEGAGHTISCQVTVSSRNGSWLGHSWGRTPEDALSQALARMKPAAMTRIPARPILQPQIA